MLLNSGQIFHLFSEYLFQIPNYNYGIIPRSDQSSVMERVLATLRKETI